MSNVFVLCTGRCGSTTFIRAAKHADNFTAAHESRCHLTGDRRFAYPERHIEADNRLSWMLARLDRAYGDRAHYVHLLRDPEATAESLQKRADRGMMLAYRTEVLMRAGRLNRETPTIDFCRDFVDTVTENIHAFLRDKSRVMTVRLETGAEDFARFWEWIGATGDAAAAAAEWDVRHNATPEAEEDETQFAVTARLALALEEKRAALAAERQDSKTRIRKLERSLERTQQQVRETQERLAAGEAEIGRQAAAVAEARMATRAAEDWARAEAGQRQVVEDDLAEISHYGRRLEQKHQQLLESTSWRLLEPARRTVRLLRQKKAPADFSPQLSGLRPNQLSGLRPKPKPAAAGLSAPGLSAPGLSAAQPAPNRPADPAPAMIPSMIPSAAGLGRAAAATVAGTRWAHFDGITARYAKLPYMVEAQAAVLRDLVVENDCRDILEVGFYHGKSSLYIGAMLEDLGRGHLVTIDRRFARDRTPNIEGLLAETGLEHRVSPRFAFRSFTWELQTLIARTPRPGFDLCYFDGGHTWDETGFGVLLVDLLLRPGGLLVLDDLDWSIATSAAYRRRPERAAGFSTDEATAPGVRRSWELILPHLGYELLEERQDFRWGIARKPLA